MPMIVTVASGDHEYPHSSKSECNHCGGEIANMRQVFHNDVDKPPVDSNNLENALAIIQPLTCGCGNGESSRSHSHSPHYAKDLPERLILTIYTCHRWKLISQGTCKMKYLMFFKFPETRGRTTIATAIDRLAIAAPNILVARMLANTTIPNLVPEIAIAAPIALIAVIHLGQTTITINTTALRTPLCLLNHRPCFWDHQAVVVVIKWTSIRWGQNTRHLTNVSVSPCTPPPL